MIKKISTKYFTNPFYIYAISFIAVTLVYSLHWSRFYDNLTMDIIFFILISSFISCILGLLLIKKSILNFSSIPISKHNKLFWRFIICGYILEFIYCGTIPLLSVVIGGIGNYRDFEGIPMFHVILSSLNTFWAVYVFVQYLSNKDNKELKRYVILAFVPHILLLNRGAIINILISCIFIYLLKIKELSFRKIMYFFIGFLCFIYVFGLIGNLRNSVSQENENYILEIGGATTEFIESNLPQGVFWFYMYTASPLGNLQYAVSTKNGNIGIENIMIIFIESCMPDFISKRLSAFFDIKSINPDNCLVNYIFNAPTAYSLPYVRAGWLGVAIMFIFMICVILLYVNVMHKSKYFLVGYSSLMTIVLLNNFNNMWYFSGLTLIIVVFLFSALRNCNCYVKKMFK